MMYIRDYSLLFTDIYLIISIFYVRFVFNVGDLHFLMVPEAHQLTRQSGEQVVAETIGGEALEGLEM